jgi:MFS family permease
MTQRPRFTILNILATIIVLAVAVAAFRFFNGFYTDRDGGEVAFWLVVFGVAVCTLLLFQYAVKRETRLILLGLAVGFGATAIGMYFGLYLELKESQAPPVNGLMTIAAILIVGGIADGLIARWKEPRASTTNQAAASTNDAIPSESASSSPWEPRP